MTLRRNPFIAGPSVGFTQSFVGREDILRRVELEIHQRVTNSCVLYGQRRIGKTSVLEALTDRLPECGPFQTVFFDLQDKAHESLDQVITLLAETIADRLDMPAPVFAGSAEQLFRTQWLPAALSRMPEESRLVLLFDEFDVLADPNADQASKALFPYLRDLLNVESRIFIVFTLGRSIGELSAIALSLFKGIQAYKISVLEQRDANHLLSLSEENSTLSWAPSARALAVELTHGHPYFLQQIGKELWISFVANHPSPLEAVPPLIEAKHVEAVLDDVIAHSQNVLEWLWDGLTPACRLVASAFAEHGSYVSSDDELQQLLLKSGVKSVINELLDAPRQLKEWDLIESVGSGYRFRVELLRTWICTNKPLRTVQDELDRLEPAAEHAYNLAVELEKSEQIDQAEQLYRLALEKNPNHVAAALALAEILIKKGALEEAERQLRLLHDNLPSRAKPKLVTVLLMRAREADEERALEYYREILQIVPTTGEARRGLQEIWHARGRRFEETERLEDALRAYREAESGEDVRRVELEVSQRRQDKLLEELRLNETQVDYVNALRIARVLSQEMPDEPPDWLDPPVGWADYIEHLHDSHSLAETLKQAHFRLNNGERSEAITLAAQVIAVNPQYPGVARLFYLAAEGREPSLGSGRWTQILPYVAAGATLTSLILLVILLLPGAQKGRLPEESRPQPQPQSQPQVALDRMSEESPVRTARVAPDSSREHSPPSSAPPEQPSPWEPPSELAARVAGSLATPFGEKTGNVESQLAEMIEERGRQGEWAREKFDLLGQRRSAWCALARVVAVGRNRDPVKARCEGVADLVLAGDDAVITGLGRLTDVWRDGPRSDIGTVSIPGGDGCLSLTADALGSIDRKSDKSAASIMALARAEACEQNPIIPALKRRSVAPVLPSAETVMKKAVDAARRSCGDTATLGDEVSVGFSHDADGALTFEVDSLMRDTPLGKCVKKTIGGRLARTGKVRPLKKNGNEQTIRF